MNIHGAASSIDVVIHAEPAEWWQVAAALTPLATSLVLLFVVVTLGRLTTATAVSSRRAESWTRAEWAMEMALDDKPERRKVGLAVLDQLSTDRLVGNEDAQIVALARALLNKH